MKLLMQKISQNLKINFYNFGDGVVNLECGSDYVKMNKLAPINCFLEAGTKWASFDGDADRVIYYYKPHSSSDIKLLDGDKIACLYALFVSELLKDCDPEGKLKVSIVQTAYSNGNSTKYIKDTLKIPVFCVATGVKNLIRKIRECDIGIYFEANGHGSIGMSKNTIIHLKSARDQGCKSAMMLLQVLDLMNQVRCFF